MSGRRVAQGGIGAAGGPRRWPAAASGIRLPAVVLTLIIVCTIFG